MSSCFELWRQERFLELLLVKKWKCTESLSSAWHVGTQARPFSQDHPHHPHAEAKAGWHMAIAQQQEQEGVRKCLEQLNWPITLTPLPQVKDKICTENGSKKMQSKWNPHNPKSFLGLNFRNVGFWSSTVESNALVYSPLLLWLPENSFSRRFYYSSCFQFTGWTFSEIRNDERNLVFAITSWCYI